ncbi:MAG: ComEC/Rec2 family competence protein [Candidatus Fermentibacteraceae bacterium]|nr:ComEC/Rec2 family competence protein [Candidatus Fermentibacteraceae bacterium]MBN2607664.1 ComEC/Rec2 family competence protein [Candidatus Fermentibacteraceae bacterium]
MWWVPAIAAGLATVSAGFARTGRALLCAAAILAGMSAGHRPGPGNTRTEPAGGVWRAGVETNTATGVLLRVEGMGTLWASRRDLAQRCSRGDSVVLVGSTDGVFLNVSAFRVLESSSLPDRARRALTDLIMSRIPSRDTASLVAALITGERGRIPPSVREAFGSTGTSHLLALSGLHVGILAGAVLVLTRKTAGSGWPAFISVTLLCGAYVMISGGRASTFRAWVMLMTLLGLWQLSGRMPHLLIVWSVAVTIMVALSGGGILEDVGAQMSFAAVLSLILLGSRIGGRRVWLFSAGYAGLVVTVSLAPLVSSVYGGFNPVAPIATAVSIPLMVLLMILGSITLMLPVIPGISKLAEWTAYLWLALLRGLAVEEVAFRGWMTAVWFFCLAGLWLFGSRRGYLLRFR